MTFHLIHADDRALLASGTAVIKRAQRVDFTDAVALLQASAAIRDRASSDAENARAAGRAEGLAEATAAAGEHIAEQLADFAAAIERHEEARRAAVAEAAHAAVRAIVGEIDDETLVPLMVERTLARLPGEGPVTISVAPDMADRLAPRLADFTHVTIIADSTLYSTDCQLRTSAGQVIASLSVQLDALARRWGIEA
ncbi:MAG: FliH/SctL family protein [Sphingomonas sp.]|jgi:flagellar biosynthesis/type III secretory pathway protein FliH|uniref:FliH/SctL family protein n=1 Tax=Sphingomonas sp. TaxID=28214 RepID=UPI0035677BA9